MDKQTKNIQRIQSIIDQSIIYCMLVNHSSHPTLNKYLTTPIPEFQSKYFSSNFGYASLLLKMNPLLNDDITEEEKEINSIIQEDNFEQLKLKFINHLLDPNHNDSKEISLIEKCVFFNSKHCLNYLLEENVSIERHTIEIDYKDNEIGLMEYGSLKGNRDIINICLEKGQKIQEITLIVGLIAHHNELVEWMIEEGKRRNHFNETIEIQILGLTNNIEFNEKLLRSGIDVNAKNNRKRRRDKKKQH